MRAKHPCSQRINKLKKQSRKQEEAEKMVKRLEIQGVEK